MCGIAGIITSKETMREALLKTIARSLAHRGPDDEGTEIIEISESDRVIGLAQRRLSIIDLSPSGHQPMQDRETGNWIVFNGEIYNFKELRRELEKQKHTFQSCSDTEVILKAYAEYGTRCVEKLRGMFAFAIWDIQDKKLFCAVDRFGIKPLYYYQDNKQFAFSSEIKALLKADIIPRTIEPLAIDSFLAYGAVQAPITMIKGVYSLLPAHMLTYENNTGTTQIREYWTPETQEAQNTTSTKEVLIDSIRHHLISDVPVALFLSGGIDSSALAILANEAVGGKALDSFSFTFAEKEYAEGQYAKIIGEQFCRTHHEITFSESDLKAFIPGALSAMDQPTVDGINVYAISKAVSEAGIKVVLSGQGGDEVFGGYSTFKRAPYINKILNLLQLAGGRPPYHKLAKITSLIGCAQGRSKYIESKISQLFASDGSLLEIYLILRQLFGPMAKKYLLASNINHDSLLNGLPREVADWLTDKTRSVDSFSALSIFELRLYLGNMLLRDGDVMSMAHSLEVRVPYLDHILLEHVMRTPLCDKTDRRLPKPLLLRTVQDKMPREIYARSKMGFTFPWEIWLRGYLRPELEKTFSALKDDSLSLLNKTAVQNLWKEFIDRKKGVSWSRVWALYVLSRWIETNIK